MSRAPSRRALLAMAGGAAAAAVPVAAVSAKPAPAAPDPVIALWREYRQAARVSRRLGDKAQALYEMAWKSVGPHGAAGLTEEQFRALHDAIEKAHEGTGYHAAYDRWNEACTTMQVPLRRLIATRPTTMRGVLAKVAAAKQLMEDDEELLGRRMLKSLLALKPDALGRA